MILEAAIIGGSFVVGSIFLSAHKIVKVVLDKDGKVDAQDRKHNTDVNEQLPEYDPVVDKLNVVEKQLAAFKKMLGHFLSNEMTASAAATRTKIDELIAEKAKLLNLQKEAAKKLAEEK